MIHVKKRFTPTPFSPVAMVVSLTTHQFNQQQPTPGALCVPQSKSYTESKLFLVVYIAVARCSIKEMWNEKRERETLAGYRTDSPPKKYIVLDEMRFVSLSCFDIFHFGFRRWRQQQQQQRAREYRENRNWPKKQKKKNQNSSSHETCQHRISLTTISTHTHTETFQFLETSSFFFFSKREKLVARRWMTRVCKTSSMKSRPMTSIASREFEMNAQSILFNWCRRCEIIFKKKLY